MSRAAEATVDFRPVTHSRAQARVVAAALELFAKHGVGGTSLQMIADEIGVTKAAVYHQYKTKEEIAMAAGEAELARLEAVVEAAEDEPTGARARRALVRGVVELAVDRRKTVSVLLSDPYVLRLFTDHPGFRSVVHRFTDLLASPDEDGQLSTVMFMAAISGAVMHPLVADLDDETLRAHLLRLAGRFVGVPGNARSDA